MTLLGLESLCDTVVENLFIWGIPYVNLEIRSESLAFYGKSKLKIGVILYFRITMEVCGGFLNFHETFPLELGINCACPWENV